MPLYFQTLKLTGGVYIGIFYFLYLNSSYTGKPSKSLFCEQIYFLSTSVTFSEKVSNIKSSFIAQKSRAQIYRILNQTFMFGTLEGAKRARFRANVPWRRSIVSDRNVWALATYWRFSSGRPRRLHS